MKRKSLMLGSILVIFLVGIGFTFWLYDNHKDMQMYERGVIYGYEDTLEIYEYLLSWQREIINEEDEELQGRLVALYQDVSFQLNPQHNTGELLKIAYVKNNPDSAIADYNFNGIVTPFALTLQEGDSKQEWIEAADNFAQAIEQMREELEVIKTELDLPPDEA